MGVDGCRLTTLMRSARWIYSRQNLIGPLRMNQAGRLEPLNCSAQKEWLPCGEALKAAGFRKELPFSML
jgi:hypothetical protein